MCQLHLSKALPFLLLICMLVFPAAAFSGSGAGTSNSPYLVETPAQFLEIRDAPSAYYKLTADIEMKDAGTWVAIPSGNPHIDGGRHVVSNLTISGGGMYAYANGASFRNIVFYKPKVISEHTASASRYTGVLVAKGDGEANIVCVGVVDGDISSTISGTAHKGMFFGYFDGGVIANQCFTTGKLSIPSGTGTKRVGGFIGSTGATGITIHRCYSDVPKPGTSVFGGFCGAGTLNKGIGYSYYNNDTVSYPISGESITGIIGITDLTNTEYFDEWLTYDGAEWVMSDSLSPLAGKPCFSWMPKPYVLIPSDLSLTVTPTSGVEANRDYFDVTWNDTAESDATGHTLTITDPEGNTHYVGVGKDGATSLRPNSEGVWSVVFTCSDATLSETVTVVPYVANASALSLTLSRDAVDVNNEVTLVWSDSEDSEQTNHTVTIYNPDNSVYQIWKASSGVKSFTPSIIGTYRIEFSCSDAIISKNLPVTEYIPPLVGSISVQNNRGIGQETLIEWQLPYSAPAKLSTTGEPFDHYEVRVYEGEDWVNTYNTGITNGAGSKKIMPISVLKNVNSASTVLTYRLVGVDTSGGIEEIDAMSRIFTIHAPVAQSAVPAPSNIHRQDITVTLDLNSMRGLLSYLHGLRMNWMVYDGNEWSGDTEVIQILSSMGTVNSSGWMTVTYTFTEDILPELPEGGYAVINLAYVIEKNGEQTEYEWGDYTIYPASIPHVMEWRDLTSGSTINSANTGTKVAFYFDIGTATLEYPDARTFYLFMQDYNPVTKEWEFVDDPANPELTYMLYTGDISMYEDLNEPMYIEVIAGEPGKTRVVLYCFDLTDVNEEHGYIAATSPTFTATTNWLSPNTGADTAGGIFGITGDAVKTVVGVFIVFGCAMIPMLVFKNQHPMVILLCAVGGMVIALAIGFIPFWVVLLLAIVAIALMLMNVRGGNTQVVQQEPPGGSP